VAKMCHDQKTDLQIIVSCNCDTCVFDEAWKHARDSEKLIVVVDVQVDDFLVMVAKGISEARK
jgi:hypothetical protein